MNKTPEIAGGSCTIILSISLILMLASPASVQSCIEYDPPPVFDTTDLGCSSEPPIDRSFFPGIITWGEHQILVHSRGNELELLDIEVPDAPTRVDESGFHVGNVGDSDYDLQLWAMCDDCRYGFASYKLGGVIFDLGSGPLPQFDDHEKSYDLPAQRSIITFTQDDHQYLVADKIHSACSGSSLFKIQDATFSGLEFLQCIVDLDGSNLTLIGGRHLHDVGLNDGQPYLWASTGSSVHVFKTIGSGFNLRLEYVKKIPEMRALAGGTHQLGFAVDLKRGLAASVSTNGLKTWRISDLENPTLEGELPDVESNILSMAYPIVWTARGPFSGTSQTFNILNLSSPAPLDQGFWDEAQPWNDLPCLSSELGGAFTPDGRHLFLSRWEVMQRFDVSACIEEYQAADFDWVPADPDIGETTLFSITGVSEVDEVTWQFGGPSCNDISQTWTCEPVFFDCLSAAYRSANSGPKTVSMTATVDGNVMPTVTHTVDVQNSGSCLLSECTYDIWPPHHTVPAAGQTGLQINLTTRQECFWEVDQKPYWVTVTSASGGTGTTTLEVSVDPNSGPGREAAIVVAGRTHTIRQSGCVDHIGRSADSGAKRVAASDGYVFAGNANGLAVLDTSDLAAPTQASTLATTSDGTAGMELHGSLLLMVGSESSMSLIDVTTPTEPEELSTIFFGFVPRGVASRGETSYVAASEAGLCVVDISNPDAPAEIATLAMPGSAQDIAISGDHLFLAAGSGGLQVFDISNPTAPVHVGTDTTFGFASAVSVIGGHAFVAGYWSAVVVFDVSTPSSPAPVGSVPLVWVEQLSVTSHHLYASIVDGSVAVFDISNPSESAPVTWISDLDAQSVEVHAGYVYVPRGPSGVNIYLGCEGRMFCDGFPTGDTRAWSMTEE